MELVTPGLANIIAYLAILLGVLLTVWWVVGLYRMNSRQAEDHLPQLDSPAGIGEVESRIPAFVTTLIIFVGISMVAYVLAVWLTGVSY